MSSGDNAADPVKMADLCRLAHEGQTSVLSQHLRVISAEQNEISKQEGWVNKPDESGRSMLHWAAAGGNVDIAKLLINTYHADPDLGDDAGWTPLLIATSAGRQPVVELLIGCGVDVNAVNTTGHSALHYAASKNRLEIAELLINSGSAVNTLDHMSSTALHRSASLGHTSITSLLIKAGANVNSANRDGNTPLHLASEEGREMDIQVLVKAGASLDCLNKEEKSPVDVAAAEVQGMMRVLVKKQQQ